MPSLTKDNLNNVSLYALRQIKDSRNTFFVPYSAKDLAPEERNKQLRVVLNSLLSLYGYTTLMAVCGVAAAAVLAGKEFVENSNNSEASAESYQYPWILAEATGTMFLHMNLDLLNFVSRVLATAATAVSAAGNFAIDAFFEQIDEDIESVSQRLQ